MSKITQRGKGKRLIKTVQHRIKWNGALPRHLRQKDREAIEAALKLMNLEARLSALQEAAERILKSHNKPHTFPFPLPKEVINSNGETELKDVDLTSNDEHYQVSYAANILITIHNIRDWVKKGNAENAAYEAIKLGQHAALLTAEVIYESKNEAQGKASLDGRKEDAKTRKDNFKKITDKLGFNLGDELDRSQKKTARELFKKEYPEYKNSPTNQTLNEDLREIGFKF